MRIYRQLDAISSEKELDRYRRQLNDRFGTLPQEVDNLFSVVKIRNLGASLGFEKVIIKNGLFIAFFISNPLSPYFKSDKFGRVLQKITDNSAIFTLKQNENKLKIVARGVDSLEKALLLFKKLD